MESRKFLLVEDNPGDVELTRRALQQSNISKGLMMMKDGVEALMFFFSVKK